MSNGEGPILKTNYITFDTSTIEKLNFTFADSRVLKRLAYLAENERIFIVLSDVTQREIEARIKVGVREALTQLKQLRKKLKILNNSATSEFGAVLWKPQEEGLVGQLIKQFHDFISRSKVEIVPAEKADITEITAQYFAGTGPFGKANKKAEFPDAIAISAVREWCNEHAQVIYVVSGDTDFQKACEDDNRLLHLSVLDEFLNLMSATDQKARTQYIHSLVHQENNATAAAIAEKFEWLGFTLADTWGDVVGVHVTSVRFSNPAVIETVDETALVSFDAEVTFDAEVSYDDLDNAGYDSSEGEHTVVVLDTIEETVEQTVSAHVQASLRFSVADPTDFEIIGVEIVGTTDIEVSARENGWPYK